MTAIEFNHVSKQYRLGYVTTRTLSADIDRWWAMNIKGQDDPYLKVGSVNDRSAKADSEFVWALRDIDFKVEQGDVLGIIGKNGAGKSTLLKLLSRVTSPTTGSICARGRIASLLEVGTGFHSELTGRENIYMNGAILGMSKAEITSKIDEIIDFAGVERYIDTPVKRYSSGMTVRLGFAVAAHLDPEIMVVDEVLAVGDAEFQKKAIGKMKEVSQGEGRTVLFVSHNMASIRNLCKTGIVLVNGSIDFSGTADEAVQHYMQVDGYKAAVKMQIAESNHKRDMLRNAEFVAVEYAAGKNVFASDESIEFIFTVFANKPVQDVRINMTVYSTDDIPVGEVPGMTFFSMQGGETRKVSLTLNEHHLAIGDYKVAFSIGLGTYKTGLKDYDIVRDTLTFQITAVGMNEKDGEHTARWNPSWGKTIIPNVTKIID